MLDIVISSRRVYFIEYIQSSPTTQLSRNTFVQCALPKMNIFSSILYTYTCIYKQQVNDIVKCVDSIKEHKTIVGRLDSLILLIIRLRCATHPLSIQ